MIYCPKCHVQLIENAKFCHDCGANVEIPLSICPTCQKMNPADAPFCYGCGNPTRAVELKTVSSSFKSKYKFEFKDYLEDQIKNAFFEELKRLGQWIEPNIVEGYLQLFAVKGFATTVELRAKQLAEQFAATFAQVGTPSVFRLEKELDNAVGNLALYHVVYNCKEINPFHLPETILKYEKARIGATDVKEMAFQFLNFENEKERVYKEFVSIPTETLQNAAKSYLFTAKNEAPFFISDQTIMSNGKEGFAMTEFAIYWKTPMEKPQKVYYHQLQKLEKKKDWITINDRFFNVNPSLNLKMLLLLERLKSMFATT